MIRASVLAVLFFLLGSMRLGDPIEQQIWLTHCDGSGWYVSTEDADSVTVRCDPKPDDPPDDPSSDEEDASAPVHANSI